MRYPLPSFQINFDLVEKQLSDMLDNNLAKIDLLCAQVNFTWDNLMLPLEALSDDLEKFWAPIDHISKVMNTDQIQEITERCSVAMTEYALKIAQNELLYKAILSIATENLSRDQRAAIETRLCEARLNGVALTPENRVVFSQLSVELSALGKRFQKNAMDACGAFKKLVTDESLMAGIPDSIKENAKQAAQNAGLEGYLLTLSASDVFPVLDYALSRELRQEIYYAYKTQASDLGPNAGEFDNGPIMLEILKKRTQLAKLMGFENYAAYAMSTKMAKNVPTVLEFLNQMIEKVQDKARREFAALSDFAKEHLGLDQLNPWDISFASEKWREKEHGFSSAQLQAYFTVDRVFCGLCEVIEKLYEIKMVEIHGVDVWHPTVRCFELQDGSTKQPRGYLYYDLFSRDKKTEGAWQNDLVSRRLMSSGELQLPVASVTANFALSPNSDKPSLLFHEDVITIFHETGHALQHLLTTVNSSFVSGTNNVLWDAIEIASQFFENWAWNKTALNTFSAIPDDLFEKLYRAKNFQSAIMLLVSSEYALFDLMLHRETEFDERTVQNILTHVRSSFSVTPYLPDDRMPNTFLHLFNDSVDVSTGYAAAYYSYLWAQVLACDAFSAFEEKGVFDRATAFRFRDTFLALGGAVDPMEVFTAFRGRKPNVNALLEDCGILQKPCSVVQLRNHSFAQKRDREPAAVSESAMQQSAMSLDAV